MTCPSCQHELVIGDFPFCPHGPYQGTLPAAEPKQRTVVYEQQGTGKIRYPGRADVPVPERYRQQGYVKREFETARALENFERKHEVVNDGLHYNNGNTHASENMRND